MQSDKFAEEHNLIEEYNKHITGDPDTFTAFENWLIPNIKQWLLDHKSKLYV